MLSKPRFLLLILLYSIVFFPAFAQQDLRIEAHIANLKPTKLILAQHFGGQLMPIDTAIVGVDGKVAWQEKGGIPAGMCRIIGMGRGVDIFVSDLQQFSFEADAKDFIATIRFTNSPDNTLFFDYQREIRKRYQPLLAYRKQVGIKDDNDPRWQSRFKELNENVKQMVDSLYQQHPQSLATHFLKSYQEPILPILPVKTLSSKDSIYLQNYVWEHYFDHSFLSDERMIYTPTFPARFERFLSILPQLSQENAFRICDNIIQETKGTTELRKYVVGQLAQKTELTPNLSYDILYEHIVSNYVEKEPALWDASMLQKLKEIKEIKENLSIGKPFPVMYLSDIDGNERTFTSLQSEYIVLFFYDPGCQHCREATPKLTSLAKLNEKQLQVYAISMDSNKTTWKSFIEEFKIQNFTNVRDASGKIEFYKLGVLNYPTIYLLNQEKKIVARWLSVEQLAAYFDNR